LISKSFLISRGGGPRTPCDATCGDKQMGEVKRVLAWRHKSAEPIEVERAGTSDPVSGSACKPAMVKETESIVDASLEDATCQLGSRQDAPLLKQWDDGVLASAGEPLAGGLRLAANQSQDIFVLFCDQNPYGVKSAPKAGKRSNSEPKNLVIASLFSQVGMIEATNDRGNEGRSLRSSLRAGKPSTRPSDRTWQREAVDTVSKQEVALCPTR